MISAFVTPTPAIGTFAVLSLMTGSAVERLVPEPLGGNMSGIEREQLDAQRVGAAAAMAFGSGVLMVRGDPRGSTLGAGENWARREGGIRLPRGFQPERRAEKQAHCTLAGLLLLLW